MHLGNYVNKVADKVGRSNINNRLWCTFVMPDGKPRQTRCTNGILLRRLPIRQHLYFSMSTGRFFFSDTMDDANNAGLGYHRADKIAFNGTTFTVYLRSAAKNGLVGSVCG